MVGNIISGAHVLTPLSSSSDTVPCRRDLLVRKSNRSKRSADGVWELPFRAGPHALYLLRVDQGYA